TPPFWFAMAMTRFIAKSVAHFVTGRNRLRRFLRHRGVVSGGKKRGFCRLLGRVATPGRAAPSRPSPLGDEAALRRVDSFLGHAVGHEVGRAILAAGALEDFRQA